MAGTNGTATVTPELDAQDRAREQQATVTPPPFRAKHAAKPPAAPVDVVQKIEAQAERIEAAVTRLGDILAKSPQTAAVIGSASATTPEKAEEEARDLEALFHLKRTQLKNGDLAYSLRGEGLREGTQRLLGLAPQYDFVRVAPETSKEHIRIESTAPRSLAVAVELAARTLGPDVVIRAKDAHLEEVVRSAVRGGLNVVNKDERVQKIVADEKAKTPKQQVAQEQSVAVIERAPAEQAKGRSR